MQQIVAMFRGCCLPNKTLRHVNVNYSAPKVLECLSLLRERGAHATEFAAKSNIGVGSVGKVIKLLTVLLSKI